MSTRAVAGGSAVGFAAGWNIADVGAVADDLAAAYGVGLAVVGLFTTVLFLSHMLMQLPSGRLSDRLGAGHVCAAGLGVLALCNGVLLIAPDPALALAARAAMGAGTALAFIGGSDYVRATGGSPFAQGLYGGLATAGGGVALAVVPLLLGPLGWRAPYASAIVVAGVAAVALAASPRVSAIRRATDGRIPLGVIVRDRLLLRLAVVFAASFGISVVVGNWVVTLLEETTGLSTAQAGALGAATLALGVVSRPLGGWLLRTQRRAHARRDRRERRSRVRRDARAHLGLTRSSRWRAPASSGSRRGFRSRPRSRARRSATRRALPRRWGSSTPQARSRCSS